MQKAIKFVQKVQLICCGAFLSVFVLLVIAQMLFRYLSIPLMWAEDLIVFSFAWAVFLGAGAMVYEKKHFSFTLLAGALKNKKAQALLSIFISIIMLVFSLAMFYYGCKLTKQFWNYVWVNIPSFKKGFAWMSMPVCGATASLYLINDIAQTMKQHFKKGEKSA